MMLFNLTKLQFFSPFVTLISMNALNIDLLLYIWQLWPEKFQNKTNGVTPRRWIRFCNPDLSKIITNWLGTEDWVTNTEKLAELRKVIDHILISYL